MDNAYLCHHGVKGMKWGVLKSDRRSRTSSEIIPDFAHIPSPKKWYKYPRIVRKLINNYDITEEAKKYKRQSAKQFASNKNAYKNANGKTAKSVAKILDSMSQTDRSFIDVRNSSAYASGEKYVARFITSSGKTPVSFADFGSGDNFRRSNIVVGTRSGKRYRRKGYATDSVKAGLDWFDSHPEYMRNSVTGFEWAVYSNNTASRRLAESLGFELESDNGEDAVYYRKRHL